MYTYSGFYVVFFTVSFIDLAPRTKSPELWAGMGRIIRSITAALTAIPMVVVFEQFGSVVLIAGSCIFSVMTLLVLFKNISVSLFSQQASAEKASEENEPLS